MCNVKTLDKPGNGFILLVLSTYKNKCAYTHFLQTRPPQKKGVFHTLCNPVTHADSGKRSSRWQKLHVQKENG